MDLKQMAETLQREGGGKYRVLQELDLSELTPSDEFPAGSKLGIMLDTETTGRNSKTDKIIELGMVAFRYSDAGEILGIVENFNALEDPGVPIPPEASAVNHITNDMVRGQKIDEAKATALLESSDLIIAHNASFDRGFIENRFPDLSSKPWACSLQQVPWEQVYGVGSGKLDYIAMRSGFFYEGHRAYIDCLAALEVLKASRWPGHEKSPFQYLLEAANSVTFQVNTVGSPYEAKDTLKANGYRWDDGSSGNERSWWKAMPEEGLLDELDWLCDNVYRREKIRVPVTKMTARERFSSRAATRHEVTHVRRKLEG